MNNPINTATDAAKRNFDMKVAFSAAVGMALFGAVTYFAVKSGVKPLKTAAKVATGGK